MRSPGAASCQSPCPDGKGCTTNSRSGQVMWAIKSPLGEKLAIGAERLSKCLEDEAPARFRPTVIEASRRPGIVSVEQVFPLAVAPPLRRDPVSRQPLDAAVTERLYDEVTPRGLDVPFHPVQHALAVGGPQEVAFARVVECEPPRFAPFFAGLGDPDLAILAGQGGKGDLLSRRRQAHVLRIVYHWSHRSHESTVSVSHHDLQTRSRPRSGRRAFRRGRCWVG